MAFNELAFVQIISCLFDHWTIGPRSFSSAGATVWNNLPDDITSAPSLTVFRFRLKNLLS